MYQQEAIDVTQTRSKRDRRVLLVQLPIPPPGPQPIQGNVPLAAAYLKLFAQRKGLESEFQIDILGARLANRLGDRAMVSEILRREPTLVGFTCYLWNIQRTLWICDRLKEIRPDLKIILGGPEITSDNQWVLGQPSIDFAAIGEGEQTFAEFLAVWAAGNGIEATTKQPIAGLWHRGGTLPVHRATLTDLDAISSPYITGLLDASEERTLLMETARGCRYKCKFCYYPKSYDSICRLSEEQISATLRHACEQGVTEIFMLDPTLNQRPHFDDFLRLLARGNPDHQFTFSAELRAEGIRTETARLLRAANFREVEVGLQSVDPEAQKLMGRNVNLELFERGTKAMLDEGIRVRVDLIIGLPGDTADSVRRGFDYLDRVRPYSELQIFNLSVLPGTAFRQTYKELGLEFQQHPPYYVLKTPALDLEMLYGLMGEAQDAFGIVFDDLPEPTLPEPVDEVNLGEVTPCIAIDLDQPLAMDDLAQADQRSLAFTLRLLASDFHAQRHAAAAVVRRILADNPHTTLQIVLEPKADPQLLTPEVMETLLATCHESLSYLDWFYSIHPERLMGAKRLVVHLPNVEESDVDDDWLAEIEDRSAVLLADDMQEVADAVATR